MESHVFSLSYLDMVASGLPSEGMPHLPLRHMGLVFGSPASTLALAGVGLQWVESWTCFLRRFPHLSHDHMHLVDHGGAVICIADCTTQGGLPLWVECNDNVDKSARCPKKHDSAHSSIDGGWTGVEHYVYGGNTNRMKQVNYMSVSFTIIHTNML